MSYSRTQMYVLGAAAIGAALVIAKVPFVDVVSLAVLVSWSLLTVLMIKTVVSKGSNGATAEGDEYEVVSRADETLGNEIASRRYQVV
jgi:hypothetical protein